MKSILLLGHGYMGQAFSAHFIRERVEFHSVNRQVRDYTKFSVARKVIEETNAGLVINCSAFVPPDGVSHCDKHKVETLRANAIFPAVLANACEVNGAILMHLSTACLYDEKREYEESDEPIRGFDGHCGTYVGSKLLAEKSVSHYPDSYVLRLRLPFDEVNHPRNYLSKLRNFDTAYDHVNSLTHRGDFVQAALDLWKFRADFGTYHVCNPGQVAARQIIMAMLAEGIIDRCPEIDEHPNTFGCFLSTKKLESAGVKLRHVTDAVTHSIRNWKA